MSGTSSKLWLDGAKALPSYLPAGTYLSFTVSTAWLQHISYTSVALLGLH
jgi:hypothetical protein